MAGSRGQLFLAGAFTYALGHVLGMGRLGSALAAITYQLSSSSSSASCFDDHRGSGMTTLLLAIERDRSARPGRPSAVPWCLSASAWAA
jgi:hypothetical protein